MNSIHFWRVYFIIINREGVCVVGDHRLASKVPYNYVIRFLLKQDRKEHTNFLRISPLRNVLT